MKSLYLANCTEYESGWGSRPDGSIICKSLDEINDYIVGYEKGGSYDCFWRFDKPVEVFCSDEVYDDIIGKMSEKDSKVLWVNDKHIKEFKFLVNY